MERVGKRPVIIEFNGLPGSGKTTIADALQAELQKHGISTCRYYFRSHWFKSTRLLYFFPQYWRCLKAGADYARLLSDRVYMPRILSMTHYIRMYREFIQDYPKEVMIIDQGIIQSFISLGHKKVLPESVELTELINIMHLNDIPLIMVNCNVSKETSNARIVSRSFNGCRVELMSDEERSWTLDVQMNNFVFVRERIRGIYPRLTSLDINSEEPVEKSIKQILATL